ncbi:hypothetical protein pdam_00009040 [Pocillopora damicornis]|uniref:VWFA domain-containing protein n=1 Tax=Pocillopora damicornis TaxID=46731 RepID=A0A3M6T9H2_POCDA|nr:hypothetical protein pdam_00009040 [Pocillopora damicornis]
MDPTAYIVECPVVMDVAFMIDVSGSIIPPDLPALKTLISKVIYQLVKTADAWGISTVVSVKNKFVPV